MRKNLLSIIVIALCAINVIFSAVLVFAVVPASMKTNQLVTQVASIIDLELEDSEEKAAKVKVQDIATYNIGDDLTINLKRSEDDNKLHYARLNVIIFKYEIKRL